MSPVHKACASCGVVIDLSPFEAGTVVRCGGCGSEVRTPPLQSTPGAVPVAPRVVSKTVQSRRPSQVARNPGRTPPSPIIWYTVGGVAVLLFFGLLWMRRDPPQATDTPGATETQVGDSIPVQFAPPRETVQSLRTSYERRRPTRRATWKDLMRRLTEFGAPGQSLLKQVGEDYLQDVDANDPDVRRMLGHHEFDHEIPEDIAFRDYPHLRAVEVARARRWFLPTEMAERKIAERAWAETQRHYAKLIDDPQFRAMDQIRANIANHPYLKDYNYATHWAAPYLICYASKARLSEYDLLRLRDPAHRTRMLKDLEQKRRKYEPLLAEKAKIFQQVHHEFTERYGAALELKDLMGEYGGRADYPLGERSFRDGCPLVVWIFEDHDAFLDYHKNVRRQGIGEGVAGYFSNRSGWVFLFDEGEDRAFEIDKTVHEGVHQLQFWYARQLNGWQPEPIGQTFFSEGLADWIGAVRMSPSGSLTFTGVSARTLDSMQTIAGVLKKKELDYPLFPLPVFVSFDTYREVGGWSEENWGLPDGMALAIFYQQAWAFLHFVDVYDQGRYRGAFSRFLKLAMQQKAGAHMCGKAFAKAFKLEEPGDWEKLEGEFRGFVENTVLKMDAGRYRYTPPARPRQAR